MNKTIGEKEATTSTEIEEQAKAAPEAPNGTATEQKPTETAENADSAEGDNPSREAAKYRSRLRETEAERDTLAERVEALQRNEIERTIRTTHKIEPAAVWANGAQLADMLDEDGAPQAAKIQSAVADAISKLGLQPKLGNYVPNEGNIPAPARNTDSWTGAFHP